MKKLICGIFLVCGIALNANAQIELEHTFVGEGVYFKMGNINGEANYISDPIVYPDNSFYSIEKTDTTYRIKIYNSDYSLHTDKTYKFTPPSGYKIRYVYNITIPSNKGNEYAFIVTFEKIKYTSNNNENEWSVIYNANGDVLKDFGTGAMVSVDSYIFIVNSKYKLLVTRYMYDSEGNLIKDTEIYSVPGTHESGTKEVKQAKEKSPFPNPANSTITLPYQLKQGETSEMRISTINGKLIEIKKVDSVFDKIMLDVSRYEKGIYIYEVNGISRRFIVN